MSYPLETQRHSAAHVMAAAIRRLFPQAKFGVGPVVEHGFYYDIDIGRTLVATDLDAIDAEMRKLVLENPSFEREEMPIDQAIERFSQLGQPYKVELLTDLKQRGTTQVRPEEAQDVDPTNVTTVSVYRTGSFVDLCRGPHVSCAQEIGVWKLTKTAGVYWRGKDTNPQMQRIYGWCFATQEELDQNAHMMAEAERRDHKKLGKELDLFIFSELVGAGLPLWTPRGTVVRNLLDEFVWSLRKAKGYERVTIPHITKKDLYVKSGHWSKFADELFRITTREGHEFAMKPMNCPHHAQIFASRPRSYREMPQRYAETTMVYRDEQSGELAGLTRVRAITQDDAHVFCRKSQIEQECFAIWDIIDAFYSTFGFAISVRLSTHDPAHMDAYLGTPEVWRVAEEQLKAVIHARGKEYVEGVGEAAMYGPKIDFLGLDAIGRKHQVATIQLDFNMPEGFDLTCVNEQGEKERIVMVHAAIMGSIERFLSILIEHYAGVFPLWLAPTQILVLAVADRHAAFAEELVREMRALDIRAKADTTAESVGKKIRNAETMKVPLMIVVGDKEVAGELFTLRERGKEVQQTGTKETVIHALVRAQTARESEICLR